MQGLSDDERRQVLGEVLSDQLQAILEYVQEIPAIKRKVNEIDERLIVVEGFERMYEIDIRHIKEHLQLA